ncbi:MAG: hypothetical protein QG646_4140 [Euryarchaeota archaeon]|nr:hypothetical protein [Euryarchaeota archaeon]
MGQSSSLSSIVEHKNQIMNSTFIYLNLLLKYHVT